MRDGKRYALGFSCSYFSIIHLIYKALCRLLILPEKAIHGLRLAVINCQILQRLSAFALDRRADLGRANGEAALERLRPPIESITGSKVSTERRR